MNIFCDRRSRDCPGGCAPPARHHPRLRGRRGRHRAAGPVEAAQQLPDIVVLDINLNGSSGLELLAAVEEREQDDAHRHVHNDSEPDMSRALRGGASGDVSKSAPADELVTAVSASPPDNVTLTARPPTSLSSLPPTRKTRCRSSAIAKSRFCACSAKARACSKSPIRSALPTRRWRIPARDLRKSSASSARPTSSVSHCRTVRREIVGLARRCCFYRPRRLRAHSGAGVRTSGAHRSKTSVPAR